MRYRYKSTIILLMMSLILAFLSMPVSGALSQTKFDRSATASVAADNNAVIDLKGFCGQYYNFSNSYSNFGKITNNTDQEMILTVSVKADFRVNNKNCTLGIRIGNKAITIKNNSNPEGELTVTLKHGQSLDIQGMLDRNQNGTVTAYFSLIAKDVQGNLTVQMIDSFQSPRRIFCY